MVRSSASGSASLTATRHRAYRDGTIRGEWQCDRYARGRVAVHLTLPLGGERTGRRIPHCHSMSSVPRRHDQGRVAVHLTLPLDGERTGWYVQVRVAVRRSLPLGIERTVLVRPGASGSASGTPGGEWQYISHCHSAVNVPGGASHTATRHRAYRAAHPTLPLGIERTETARSGASGSATLNLRGSRRGSQEGSRRGSQLQANDKGRPRVLRDLPPLDHTSARQASLPCAR